MKKKLFVLLSVWVVGLLSACGGASVDKPTAEKYSKKAEEVILLMNEGKYEEVHDQFDATMKESLSLTQMEDLTPILEQAGTFDKIDKTSVSEKDDHTIVVSVAKYSEENRVYTITFNEEDEIAGLYIK